MNRTTVQPFHIPEEVQEQAKELIKGAFRLFDAHNRKLAQDLNDFAQRAKAQSSKGT